ncbi:MAG: metallophosphoesterase, partial [Gemmatimonadota bacterium]
MPSSTSRNTADIDSSRTSRKAAGWACKKRADLSDAYRPDFERRQFSWISPKPLWDSRNDRIARWVGDSTDDERMRWIEAQRRKGIDPSFTVSSFADRDELSFFVLGDPGEGDDSQYHVLGPLHATKDGIAFTYILSDVIYPAGDVHDYYDKFFWPYQKLPGPIYAIPGNHDWYDGLHGFMIHLCDADPDLRPPPRREKSRLRRVFFDLTWREASEAMQEELEEMRKLRPDPSNQPAPYFVVELKDLLLVGVDTGIRGVIDKEQAEWLHTVSKLPKDKILMTGKPMVVDAGRKTTEISGTKETVNALVDDPAHRYIAVMGGDIHNYQRYPVRHDDGRVVQHIVSGAAGAYTKATHKIPRATVEGCGCDEADFRCYPRRGDSLAAYSVLYDRKFGLGKGLFRIPYE